jgi:ubiquinone biosynthesis UbiH/UbiF/VisC/COQ6 family hydroxylase
LTHIVDVPALESLLSDAISFQPSIQRVQSAVEAKLTVVCEGRHSATRQELGVDYDTLPYAQHALATRVHCAKQHRQQALQWFSQQHGELDILALLPLGGPAAQQAAVVWSMPSALALKLQQASADHLSHALTQASHEVWGELKVTSAVHAWPLQLAKASRWSGQFSNGNGWVLAGDAAHSIHPLAGLGLNLGLADASELSSVLKERETTAYWRSVADAFLLRRYERARKAGLLATWVACDGIQRLFNHPNTTAQSLRNWGLNRFNQLTPLKQWAMNQAMY